MAHNSSGCLTAIANLPKIFDKQDLCVFWVAVKIGRLPNLNENDSWSSSYTCRLNLLLGFSWHPCLHRFGSSKRHALKELFLASKILCSPDWLGPMSDSYLLYYLLAPFKLLLVKTTWHCFNTGCFFDRYTTSCNFYCMCLVSSLILMALVYFASNLNRSLVWVSCFVKLSGSQNRW